MGLLKIVCTHNFQQPQEVAHEARKMNKNKYATK